MPHLHERLQVGPILVVHGVGFEDQTTMVVQYPSKLSGRGSLVVDHALEIELHTGLHGQGYSTIPRPFQTLRTESVFVGRQGSTGYGAEIKELSLEEETIGLAGTGDDLLCDGSPGRSGIGHPLRSRQRQPSR